MPLSETLRIRVNGDVHEISVEPHRTLLEVLRDDLELTGTKRGCDDASCGACTVLVDGKPWLSCVALPFALEDADIVTIEGASRDPAMTLLKETILREGGLQCGYCTPGIVLAARALLERRPCPDEADIREGISNNLCRCTGYLRIVEAVREAARLSAAGAGG
ncbi:MAG TPA: (2Fe-2S)-binding protein [Planctomycetota bacterium]|nr:(2Fe-2S)-binding protein [Planctomycetota bacterium]